MQKIFSDFEILKLIKDHEAPGVFLKAKKPFNYSPNDLQDIALFSMILGRRTTSIPKLQEMPFSRKAALLILKVMRRTYSFVYNAAYRLIK
ncbi:MAG: hypothetical protein NDF58_03375 [archaeon YNP-LCB-024-027]|nr:hypothetical protein [Candidatus Culexarchaeum yellowstonense]